MRRHACQFARTLKKWSEPIGEISPRHDVQPSRLPRHRFDQARVAVSETDGRVGAHHVEITATSLIPDMDALTAHERDGQRLVIARAITGFEAPQLAHCSLS
jgi:hypothetical protein